MASETAHILVVDDDESIRVTVEIILKTEGYNIITCKNGYEAIEILENKDFHLVISDIIMPDMDGIGFLRSIRNLGKQMNVIMISGNQIGRRFFRSAQLLGAKASLTKPFSRTELVETVKSVLEG